MKNVTRQRGFSIVTAIFLVVILATLGTFMVRMTAVQSESVSLSIQAARVYQAAQGGIEWGLYQAIENDSCLANSNFTLLGFDVTVTCNATNHPVTGGDTRRVYTIRSTARFGTLGEPTHVQRVIEVRASNLV